MIRSLYPLLLLAFLPSLLPAQTAYGILDGNAMHMRIFSNGLIGADVDPTGAVEVPGGAGTTVIYGAGLWLSGNDAENTMRIAAHYYGANGHDMYSGPLTTDGSATITADVIQQYDRIWKVNGSEITMHSAFFNCLSDPDCDADAEFPGYTIPSDFMNWPAQGNVNAGQAAYLAPFVDISSDGFYDAAGGDMPCTPGDQAMFMIFNDKGGPHMETNGMPIGIEVHMLAFSYAGEPHLDHTVFVHYKIINRGSHTLSNFRISSFADVDIGCPDDDFVGTDVQRNMVYGYNASDIDPDCLGSMGYGAHPPAIGIMVLKGPLMDANGSDNVANDALPAYNGTGFGDGIADNERHGLSNSMYFVREGNSAMVNPAIATHFNDYMNSRWLNSLPLTYGGNGYSEAPGAIPSRFAFPGDSDPVGAGTNGVPQPVWVETEPDLAHPDRSLVATMGPITLEPGEEQEILLAYVYARTATGNAWESVEALKLRADSVHDFAQTIPGIMAEGTMCDPFLATTIHEMRGSNERLLLYPNPVVNTLSMNVTGFTSPGLLRVFDARGTLVLEKWIHSALTDLDISALSAGLYQVRYENSGTVHIGRFVKE